MSVSKSGQMNALRKMRAGAGLSLESAPVPSVGPTDVLVRVTAASICGTDLHIYGWDRWSQARIKPPVTLGHEFSGIVERVGEEVSVVKAGDKVSAEMHLSGGHCHQCRLGESHICQNLRIIGIDRDGAFAEFVKIPASNIWKLDPAIPEHYGAILDPLGNAVKQILADTSNTGVDVLLEMSGNPTAIQQGFAALRAGGRASLLGIPTESVPLDLVNDVIFKGATVQGIYGRRMYGTWVQMTALLKAGRLDLEPLFGEREPLEEFESGFRKLQGGLAGKILMYPDGVPH